MLGWWVVEADTLTFKQTEATYLFTHEQTGTDNDVEWSAYRSQPTGCVDSKNTSTRLAHAPFSFDQGLYTKMQPPSKLKLLSPIHSNQVNLSHPSHKSNTPRPPQPPRLWGGHRGRVQKAGHPYRGVGLPSMGVLEAAHKLAAVPERWSCV